MGMSVGFSSQALEQPGNTWRFLVTLIFDQVKNGYIYFTLKVSVYLVNVVFGHRAGAEEELLVPDNPEKTAQVIGLMCLGFFWSVCVCAFSPRLYMPELTRCVE